MLGIEIEMSGLDGDHFFVYRYGDIAEVQYFRDDGEIEKPVVVGNEEQSLSDYPKFIGKKMLCDHQDTLLAAKLLIIKTIKHYVEYQGQKDSGQRRE